MQNILHLASQSPARKRLLDIAQIQHKIIKHESDECGIELSKSFDKYVLAIARHKMEHAVLPQVEGEIFVLTADTLVRTMKTKEILGKPTDRDDAERMLGLLREGPAELVTGCCLEKKIFINGSYKTLDKRHWATGAMFEFLVPKDSVDKYYRQIPEAMYACGGSIIEGYGLNFLKYIDGSITAIIGIPLVELHKNLSETGF
jgi:septum formation protein